MTWAERYPYRKWPSGEVQTLRGVAVNQRLTITEARLTAIVSGYPWCVNLMRGSTTASRMSETRVPMTVSVPNMRMMNPAV